MRYNNEPKRSPEVGDRVNIQLRNGGALVGYEVVNLYGEEGMLVCLKNGAANQNATVVEQEQVETLQYAGSVY